MAISPLTTTETLAATMEILRPPVAVLDDFGRVDKQVVHIHWGEQVEWVNTAENDVQIVFDEFPPFEWPQPFAVPHGARRLSGAHKPDVLPGHRYKYTVIGLKGNYDPIIIIDK